MSERTVVRTIKRVQRMPTSPSGNPRFLVWFEDMSVASTDPDGAVAFDLDNSDRNFGVPVSVTYSAKGRIVALEPVR